VQVLDNARDKKDISFILGYISHCALDITFHPVIYYLSGNYYDESPQKRARAVYLHRHLETCLDLDIKNSMRLPRLIRTKYLVGLVFEEIISQRFKVPIKSLRYSLRRQIIYNVLFTSNAAYHLAKLASKTGLFNDTSQLGLFYGDAEYDEQIPSMIEVADLIEGRQWATTINELFSNARTLAESMMEAAYGYSLKSVTRDEMLKAIPGLSLDTGKLGVSASSIRHTKGDGALKES
jgi:hypothetical protein